MSDTIFNAVWSMMRKAMSEIESAAGDLGKHRREAIYHAKKQEEADAIIKECSNYLDEHYKGWQNNTKIKDKLDNHTRMMEAIEEEFS